MFIQTETTPNPNMLKFLPNQAVMGEAPPADFPTAESAQAVPLANALFAISGVSAVFFGKDFITIGKTEEAGDWTPLSAQILGVITDYLSRQEPIMPAPANKKSADNGADSSIVRQIKELLDSHIRPAVAQDGGDIVFDRFADGVVWLHLRGACAGCPASAMTLKQGVENLLQHYIPAVQEVRAIEG